MNEEIQKSLIKIITEINKEKGSSRFFGAFLNPDILKNKDQEKWDLIFSASWFKERGGRKDYEYVFSKIIRNFNSDQLSTFLEKLYLVDVNDPVIKKINTQVGPIENGMISLEPLSIQMNKNRTLEIPKALIFSSASPTKRKVGIKAIQLDVKNDFPKSKGVQEGNTPNALGKISTKRRAR